MSLKRKPDHPLAASCARPITSFFTVLPREGAGEALEKKDEVAAEATATIGARETAAGPPPAPVNAGPASPAAGHTGEGKESAPAERQPSQASPDPEPGSRAAHSADDQAASPDPASADPGAAYEAERAARIQRNAAIMAGLGIAGALAPPAVAQQAKQPRPTARRPRAPPPPPEAVRRSGRHRGGGPVAGGNATTTTSPARRPRSPTPKPVCFDDETVLRYVASAAATGRPSSTAALPAGPTLGFAPLPVFLACPQIARLYSIAAHTPSGLLAAGGKDGWAAVWGVRGWLNGGEGDERAGGDDDLDLDLLPLAAGRLHRSWLADVALVDRGSDGSLPLLLSAANDGAVAVWNLAACATGGAAPTPQQLALNQTVHGGAGIFSLDAAALIATSAKDGSIVASIIHPDGRGVVPVATWEDAHAGVAKCVRWGGEAATASTSLLASCGNDGHARAWDTRVPPSSGPVADVAAFACAANAVRWVPPGAGAAAPRLVLAGADPDLRLFDLRMVSGATPSSSLTTPALTLRGHIPAAGRVAGIYQPTVFGGSSPLIVAGGPKARSLSLYRGDSGATVSRGEVDHDSVTLAAVGGLLAVAGSRGVHLYKPRGAG